MNSDNSVPRRTASGDRREWSWYLGTAIGAAFATNWFWEMLQMPAYRDFDGSPWRETIGRCTLASAGDVFLTLLAYAAGAAVWRDWRWGRAGGAKTFLALALLALGIACAVELGGVALGRWSYNERMPVVPGTRLGVLPLAQLTLLVPLSFWVGNVARRFALKGRN